MLNEQKREKGGEGTRHTEGAYNTEKETRTPKPTTDSIDQERGKEETGDTKLDQCMHLVTNYKCW